MKQTLPSETCCNYGKTFSRQQGEKSYSRKSLEYTVVINKVNKTLGALVEEEFNVTLTLDQILCTECTWACFCGEIDIGKERGAVENTRAEWTWWSNLSCKETKVSSSHVTKTEKKMRTMSPK